MPGSLKTQLYILYPRGKTSLLKYADRETRRSGRGCVEGLKRDKKIKLTLETTEVGKDVSGVVISCRLTAKNYSALLLFSRFYVFETDCPSRSLASCRPIDLRHLNRIRLRVVIKEQ